MVWTGGDPSADLPTLVNPPTLADLPTINMANLDHFKGVFRLQNRYYSTGTLLIVLSLYNRSTKVVRKPVISLRTQCTRESMPECVVGSVTRRLPLSSFKNFPQKYTQLLMKASDGDGRRQPTLQLPCTVFNSYVEKKYYTKICATGFCYFCTFVTSSAYYLSLTTQNVGLFLWK